MSTLVPYIDFYGQLIFHCKGDLLAINPVEIHIMFTGMCVCVRVCLFLKEVD